MSEMPSHNSIQSEANLKAVLDAMPEMRALHGAEWDGCPKTPPDITVRAWWIDPYWYVATSDGVHRVTSTPDVTTDEALMFTAGEQVRILLLPDFRREFEAKR